MDANRQRFWLLADAPDWATPGTDVTKVEYATCAGTLRLRDRRPARVHRGALNPLAGNALLGTPARAADAFGTVAYWNPETRAVEAEGAFAQTGDRLEPVVLWNAPVGERVCDLGMGFDDVLYLAVQERGGGGTVTRSYVGLFDPRGRWRTPAVFVVDTGEFQAEQVAADPSGGVWVLDRAQREVGRVKGLPLRDGLPPRFDPTTFRPCEENVATPRFHRDARQPSWTAGEVPVTLACSPGGRLALIAWRPDDETWLHLRTPGGEWLPPRLLVDAGRPTSVAWVSEHRVAVMPGPRLDQGLMRLPREAIPYDPDDAVDERRNLQPAGDFLPLRHLSEGLFLKGTQYPPRYLSRGAGIRPVALLPLSYTSYVASGTAVARVIDGGQDQTVWHRLYAEWDLPPRCGAVVSLAASDNPHLTVDELSWFPHVFGDEETEPAAERSVHERAPRGVWLPDRSELPHHAGLLRREPVAGRTGLFTALIQRTGCRVRRLTGRYLHVRVTLHGTGDKTPELAALRIYGSRFSYRDHYLAEVYRETEFGEDADAAGAATGPDFLDRYLGLFESVLTPLEDRAAFAQIVMDPRSAPDEALEWLGSWLGLVFGEAFSVDRRRAWIEAAPRLFQTRGTLAGLQLALEIATGGRMHRGWVEEARLRRDERPELRVAADPATHDLREVAYPFGGGVTGGEILVIENFKLRRTFAAILGADLSPKDDPLLPGLIVSANSRVGDSLILGEAEQTELLALFRDAFSTDAGQRQTELRAVREFYEKFAQRITIFVHQSVTPQDLALIQRIAEQEAPAHLVVTVVTATEPLLVGLSSLVCVDTYLGPSRAPQNATLGRSTLGGGDFIRRQASLDPRLGGGRFVAAPPVAKVAAPPTAPTSDGLTLDGSASTAAPGRTIDRYRWTLLSPPR